MGMHAEGLLRVSSLPLVLTDKTVAIIAECSGTFQGQPQPEEQRKSELQKEGDSSLEKGGALQHGEMRESHSQPANEVGSKPEESQVETEGPSKLREEGHSQLESEVASPDEVKDKPREELDSKLEEPDTAQEMGSQAVSSEQESWLLVNGGLGAESDQEARPEPMVDTEDNKGSMLDTAGVNNIVEKLGDGSVSSAREGPKGVEDAKPGSEQSSFEAEKVVEQEVTAPQEIKPQEEPKLQEGGWIDEPPETRKNEASLPPASWVLVTGGEHQDGPTSVEDTAGNQFPNEDLGGGKGEQVEAVQEPEGIAEGLNKGESQTVPEIEGIPRPVETDITKADPDPPKEETPKIQQQAPVEMQSKASEAVATSASNNLVPPPKPERGRSLKGAKAHTTGIFIFISSAMAVECLLKPLPMQSVSTVALYVESSKITVETNFSFFDRICRAHVCNTSKIVSLT